MKGLPILLLLLASGAAAQNTLSLSCPVTSGKPGTQLSMAVNYSGVSVSGLEWGLTWPTGFIGTATAGPAATAAQKTVDCTATAGLCLLAGLNQLTMNTGVVANYTMTLPATPGTYSISLIGSNTLASSGTGTAVAVATGNPCGVTVLSRFDLNSDGVIDSLDLGLAEAQALGTCTTADFNGDGRCDITDVELLVLAQQGVIPK